MPNAEDADRRQLVFGSMSRCAEGALDLGLEPTEFVFGGQTDGGDADAASEIYWFRNSQSIFPLFVCAVTPTRISRIFRREYQINGGCTLLKMRYSVTTRCFLKTNSSRIEPAKNTTTISRNSKEAPTSSQIRQNRRSIMSH